MTAWLEYVPFIALVAVGLGGMIGAWLVPGGPLRLGIFCAGTAVLVILFARIG
jgi:hypothetical protein